MSPKKYKQKQAAKKYQKAKLEKVGREEKRKNHDWINLTGEQ